MKTGVDGIALMHFYEGCSLSAYPDPATGGAPWTIGWGDTGPDVKQGMVITQQEADERFQNRLAREFEPGVRSALQGRDVTQREFDALVCFAYNLGLASLRSSTLLKMIHSGDKRAASEQFARWDRANGKRMLGLHRRRISERALFLGADASQAIKTGQAIKSFG